jgi:hypothetical protein
VIKSKIFYLTSTSRENQSRLKYTSRKKKYRNSLISSTISYKEKTYNNIKQKLYLLTSGDRTSQKEISEPNNKLIKIK